MTAAGAESLCGVLIHAREPAAMTACDDGRHDSGHAVTAADLHPRNRCVVCHGDDTPVELL